MPTCQTSTCHPHDATGDVVRVPCQRFVRRADDRVHRQAADVAFEQHEFHVEVVANADPALRVFVAGDLTPR